jgi:hypothetical protein
MNKLLSYNRLNVDITTININMKKTVNENVQRLLSIKEMQHLFNESDFKYYFNKITKNKGNYNLSIISYSIAELFIFNQINN